MRPKVAILRSDGANCDEELFYAFEKFGASPKMVHVNELRDKSQKLANYQILALPGGFSYGDDIASGKVLALELISYLKDDLQNFIEKDGLVLGICNGFQTLVRTGLLPFRQLGKMDVTLAQNDSGHFECRWVHINPQKSKCLFVDNSNQILDIAVNHGEGKFFATKKVIGKIENEELVVYRYVDSKGKVASKYPDNPNGSVNAIAAVCDPTGRILGMMPHPEKFIEKTQHPNWRRSNPGPIPNGFIFQNLIEFSKQQ